MTRYMVTGSSGFVGTNVMRVLAERADSEVLGIDILPPRDVSLSRYTTSCDIRDEAALKKLLSGYEPDVVLHMAARTDLDGERAADYDSNILGVRSLLNAVSNLGYEPRVIYASSRLVFAINHQPTNDYDYLPSTPYGESKIEGELLVRHSGMKNWVIARPTSLWGPWFGVPYRNFFDAVRRGYFFKVRRVNPRKSFGYVGNAVHELLALANASSEACGRPYWICDYEPYLLNDWADEVQTALRAPKIRTLPLAALRMAARVGDLSSAANLPAPITSFRLNNLITNMVYDVSGTAQLSGDLPYTRLRGVRTTADWLVGRRRHRLDGDEHLIDA